MRKFCRWETDPKIHKIRNPTIAVRKKRVAGKISCNNPPKVSATAITPIGVIGDNRENPDLGNLNKVPPNLGFLIKDIINKMLDVVFHGVLAKHLTAALDTPTHL